MILQKRPNKIGFFIAILIASVFIFNDANAAGLTVGNASLNLAAGENIYYGVTSASNANGNFLLFEKGAGNTVFKIDYNGNITTNGSLLGSNSYWNLSGNNLYASNTSWNLGIGTTNPVSQLTMFGANPRLSIVHNVLNAGDTGIDFVLNPLMTVERKNAIIVQAAGSYGRGDMSFVLDSTLDSNNYNIAADTKMIIKNSGNVGIGTTAPSAILDVSGKVKTTSGGTIYNTDSSRWLDMTGTLTDSLRVSGNIITTSGNVGIGTTAPTSKLDIQESRNFDTVISALSVTKTGGATLNNQSTIGVLSQITVPDSADTFGYAIKGDSVKVGSFGTHSAGVLGQGRYNGTPIYSLAGLSLFGVSGFTQITGNTTALPVGNAYSLFSSGDIQSSLTNYYGVYLAAPSGAGAITNKYGLYQNDTNSKNYFAGNVGIGTNNPATTLDVRSTTPAITIGTVGGTDGAVYFGNGNHGVRRNYSGVNDIGLYTTSADIYLSANGNSVTNQFVLKNNGNVGIGITAPDAKLDVAGSFRVQSPYSATISGLSGTGGRIVMADASGTLYATSSAIASGIPAAGALGQTLYSNGLGWVASASPLFNNGTNVGIGTTAPSAILDVSGKVKTTSGGTIYNADSSRWLDMTGTLTDSLKVSGNIITTAGNVGVGTTNPIAELEIAGGSGSSKIYKEVYTGQPDYSYYYLKMFKVPLGSNAEATTFNGKICAIRSNDLSVSQCSDIHVSRGYNGIMYFSQNTSAVGGYGPFQLVKITDGGYDWMALMYDAHLGAGIKNWTLDGVLFNDSTSDVISLTSKTSTTSIHSALTYTARNTVITDGNVGIGTTNPGTRLQVNAASGSLIPVFFGTNDYVWGSSGSALNVQFGATSGNTYTELGAFSAGGGSWNNLILQRGGGNVGIGTTNPVTAKLVVIPSGNYSIDVAGGRIANLSSVADTDAATVGYVKSVAAGTSTVPTVGYWTANGANIYNANTGSVGIGTTGPAGKLNINETTGTAYGAAQGSLIIDHANGGGASSVVFRSAANRGSDFGFIQYQDAATVGGAGESARLIIGTSNDADDHLLLMPTGNVGIGSTVPSASLDIFGKLKFTSGGTIYNTDSSRWLDMTGTLTDSLKVSGNIITTSGDVGIGTTAPNASLDIYNGAFVNRTANINHYRNVLMSYLGNGGQTGTLKIVLPKQADTMIDITIKGYDYTGIGAWEARVSGYVYSGSGGGWYTNNHKAQIIGSAPFSLIRLAYDGSKPVILLGNTSTVWSFGSIEVTDVTTTYGGINDWGTGWSSSLITSETGLTTIATPTIYTYTNSIGNVGIGTISPSAKLDIRGTLKADSGNFSTDGLGNTTFESFLDRTNPLYKLDPSSSATSLNVAGSIYSSSGVIGMSGTGNNYLMGNLGIGTTATVSAVPVEIKKSGTWLMALTASGTSGSSWFLSATDNGFSSGAGKFIINNVADSGSAKFVIDSGGNVGIGSLSPSPYRLYVSGSAYINGSLTMASSTTLSMPNSTLTVNKLTVNTIDPLYNIKGINYSSFAASVVGGVKEEVTGKINIKTKTNNEYQAVINFDNQMKGSDLWVWYSVIDFSKDNVEAIVTPYGGFANVYYSISGHNLIFHSNQPVEASYRLLAKRFDWEQWPTKAKDQKEKAGFYIK